MSTIARMNVVLDMDSKDFEQGVKNATAAGESLSSKLSKIGAGMTAGITLPIIGAATAAVKFATDFNSSMANVASLGVASDRVNELKGNIQTMAVETGKSTDDLAGGLYQVISAFGDSADTASILEINAKAAAAGLATTTEAIDLTSAVTKGWGDTSATAVQHAADLAQQTVVLGQTTFPELAGSVGKVVPLMASLGGTQEELFATMATATGVTGGAAEVSTQLRGVLQSLMAPTEDMSTLMASMGYETGAALLQGEGLQGTIVAVTKAAEASGKPLQSYIGSVEGQTLALALAGPQADAYTEKLAAMSNVAGVADAAFKAQTQGVNKAGFTMKQLAIKAQVVAQKIGDGLAPALAAVFDIISPLADKVVDLANWFAEADTNTQMWVVGIAAAIAALGPLLTILPAIATAVSVLFSPVGLVIAAVAALAAAWATNFGGIQQKTQAVFKTLQPIFDEMKQWLDMAMKGDFSGITAAIGDTLNTIKVAIATFKWSDFITPLTDWAVYIATLAWDTVITTLTNWGTWISSLDWGSFITALTDWGEYIKGTVLNWADYISKLDWGSYIKTALEWGTYITATLSDWGTYIISLDWGTYVKPLADWGTYITATLSDWGAYVTKLDWGGYVAALSDWGTYITATLSDWSTYITSIDWGTYITATLSDWNSYISKLGWGDYISKLWTGYVTKLNWGDYVSTLSWSDFLTKNDWALWIPSLVWSVVITPVRWATWIPQLLWDNVISKLSWDGFIKAITSWDTYVSMLQWSTLVFPVFWPAFIDKLGVTQWIEAIGASPQWKSFISKLDWLAVIPGFTWPSWVTALAWGDFIPKLLWPAIEAPTWLDFIEDLTWPTIKAPKWSDFIPDLSWPKIDAFPGWADILRALGWGGPPAGAPGTGTTGTDGTSAVDITQPGPTAYVDPVTGEVTYRAKGGPVSSGVPYIVGEKGAEMFIPNVNGQVIPNNELGGWLDSVVGAAGVNGAPMIGVANVYNEVDIRALAYQVAEYQARRR